MVLALLLILTCAVCVANSRSVWERILTARRTNSPNVPDFGSMMRVYGKRTYPIDQGTMSELHKCFNSLSLRVKVNKIYLVVVCT